MKTTNELRIVAFGMKGLRKILRVLWRARKTNDWFPEKSCDHCDQETTIFWFWSRYEAQF